MRKIIKNLTGGRGFILSLFITLLFSKANAQAIKPNLNRMDGIVYGLVFKYTGYVKPGDTAFHRIEISETPSFSLPISFKFRRSDTTQNYTDTLTKAMGLDTVKYYGRIWTYSLHGNDSFCSSVYTAKMKLPLQKAIYSVYQTLPTTTGVLWDYNANSGGATDTMTVAVKWSSDSINFFPGGTNRIIIGAKTARDSIIGLGSGVKRYVRITYWNDQKIIKDTTIGFKTGTTPKVPVVTITSVKPGINSVEVKGKITSFGLQSKLSSYCGKDTQSGNFTSTKTEDFSFTISGLPANSNVSGKFIAVNAKGSSAPVTWNTKTLPAPVQPTVVITDIGARAGEIEIKWNWQTNSDNLFVRTDAKVYTDSLEQSPAISEQLNNGSSLISGNTFNILTVDPGTYWVRLIGETANSNFVRSNLFKVTVSWGTGIKSITLITEPVTVQVYDVSGKFLGLYEFSNTNYSNLPANQILFIKYTDSQGQTYAGKISVQ